MHSVDRVVWLGMVAALGCSTNTGSMSDPSACAGVGVHMTRAGTTGASPRAGSFAASSGSGRMPGGPPVSQAGSGPVVTTATLTWPTFGGDLSHTRSSALETTLSTQNVAMLKPAFDIPAPGVTATPAVYGDTIY